MKIALIHFNLTTESGDPRMALLVARTFKELGHMVVVYAAEFDPACFPEIHSGLEIRIVRPPAPLSSVFGASGIIGKISERVRRNRLFNQISRQILSALDKDFDLIYCENDDSYKTGAFYRKEINKNAKVIWMMNNPPFYHSRKENFILDMLSRIANWRERFLARKFSEYIDAVVVYDNEREVMKVVQAPVKVLSIPIDFNLFYAAPKKLDRSRPIRILGVGALSPARRYEDIISAAVILREEGYDTRVLLICKDYWRDGAYRKNFGKFISDSGIAEYVEARYEGAKEKDYIRALKEADIFISPNNIIVMALSALEAIAAGVPLIVSRVTSTARFLKDGETALFVDPLRPDQIADQAKRLIDDREFYARIARAGQELVKNEMSLEKFVGELIALPKR